MHLDALGYLHQPTVDQVPDLAPTLCASVRKRIANRRTVKEALGDNTWVRGIRGGLSALASSEYLQLWYLLISFELTPAIDDQAYMDAILIRWVHNKISQPSFLCGISEIWDMEGNMEGLGSTSMKILCLVGLLKLLLDGWSFVPPWTWSPGALPTVRPRGRDGATFTHFLCVCKECLVFSAINSWAAALNPRFRELQFYRLVVSCFTDGSQFTSQGLQLLGCFGGMVDL